MTLTNAPLIRTSSIFSTRAPWGAPEYNPRMETVVRTMGELEAEAARFAATLGPQVEGATLVTLSGELGAGKTVFVKALAKVLGIEDTVTSPTFVLEKIYSLTDTKCPSAADGHLVSVKGFRRLVHIDAYRLDEHESLAPLGFDELMRDPSNLILLEWPERVAGLPEPTERIHFEPHLDGSRTLSYGN